MICFKNFFIAQKICLELPERSPKNINEKIIFLEVQ